MTLAPNSIAHTRSLIETVFPAQKIGFEAQKERKAGRGQILTSLGSYWKGRKPLILVRACILAALMPASDNPEKDLEIFEKAMNFDPKSMKSRSLALSAETVWTHSQTEPDYKKAAAFLIDTTGKSPRWIPEKNLNRENINSELPENIRTRQNLSSAIFDSLSYAEQVLASLRIDEIEEKKGTKLPIDFESINKHLHTSASSFEDLINELGIARFGHTPTIGDPFSGGGSIPFEAARIGCNVNASDLNPVACMLTHDALNLILTGDPKKTDEYNEKNQKISAELQKYIDRLGIEKDQNGNQAKYYIYCLEITDPTTGWRVPLSPSWVISQKNMIYAFLIPDHNHKRFTIDIRSAKQNPHCSPGDLHEFKQASKGTITKGIITYETEDTTYVTTLSSIRGDNKSADNKNLLRQWSQTDVAPIQPTWNQQSAKWEGGDIFTDRLYCIQWISKNDIESGKAHPETWFSGPIEFDLKNEEKAEQIAKNNIEHWQNNGFIPSMPIEDGDKTSEPKRTRGWTHWNHLFSPRHLIILAKYKELCNKYSINMKGTILDNTSKLTKLDTSRDNISNVFYNQALNCQINYGSNSALKITDIIKQKITQNKEKRKIKQIQQPASKNNNISEIWCFDPPYGDAVHYHEITEYFIAWFKNNTPAPYNTFTWDSRRPLAIKGEDHKFRLDMIDTFKNMHNHMPDNGMQICMFTHKNESVWSHMAYIFWGAKLTVSAAWYISTETEGGIKKGGYVGGTVILVLRKRTDNENAYRQELIHDIRDAVAKQISLLTGLNQSAKSHHRSDNPFNDADIQMAAYAAALNVLTSYSHIDGQNMAQEAMREKDKHEHNLIGDMIAMAVETATNLIIPNGLTERIWDTMQPTERFWLTMAHTEATRPQNKLDTYQNLAKTFRANGWESLMADQTPNKARLKTPSEFKRSLMSGHTFSEGSLRPVFYAIHDLAQSRLKDENPSITNARVLSNLKDNLPNDWTSLKPHLIPLTEWLSTTLRHNHPDDAQCADILHEIIVTERI